MGEKKWERGSVLRHVHNALRTYGVVDARGGRVAGRGVVLARWAVDTRSPKHACSGVCVGHFARITRGAHQGRYGADDG